MRTSLADDGQVDVELLDGALQGLLDDVLQSVNEGFLNKSPNKKLVRSVVCLIDSVADAMEVENALNCSCPVRMERHAHEVVTRAAGVLGILEQPIPEHAARRGFHPKGGRALHPAAGPSRWLRGLRHAAPGVRHPRSRPPDHLTPRVEVGNPGVVHARLRRERRRARGAGRWGLVDLP